MSATLSELTGGGSMLEMRLRRDGHPVVSAVREAIESAQLSISPEPRPDPGELIDRTAYLRRLWHTSSTFRANTGALLPDPRRSSRRADP